MPGASIRDDGTPLSAGTDRTGAFTLVSVPQGARKITVAFLGFEPQTLDVTVPAGGRADDLAVELEVGIR